MCPFSSLFESPPPYSTHGCPGSRFGAEGVVPVGLTLLQRKDQIEGSYYLPVGTETKAWPLALSPPTNLSLNGRFNFLLLFERKEENPKQAEQGCEERWQWPGGDSCCIHG